MVSEKTRQCLADHVNRVMYSERCEKEGKVMAAVKRGQDAYHDGTTVDIMAAIDELANIKTKSNSKFERQE